MSHSSQISALWRSGDLMFPSGDLIFQNALSNQFALENSYLDGSTSMGLTKSTSLEVMKP